MNNAGIAVMAPVDDYRLEDFDRMVAVNLRAVFVATQAAVKHMPAGGRVITVRSRRRSHRVTRVGRTA